MISAQEKAIVNHFVSNEIESAIQLIHEYYSPALFGFVLKMVHSKEIAQDILQESFVKFWKNAHKYDSSKGRLFTWLINITRNTALDKLKTKKYQTRASIQSLNTTVHDTRGEEMATDGIGVNKYVEQLESPDREIMILAYYQGYSQREIAQQMTLPLGTVKSKVRSSLKKLRILMQVTE